MDCFARLIYNHSGIRDIVAEHDGKRSYEERNNFDVSIFRGGNGSVEMMYDNSEASPYGPKLKRDGVIELNTRIMKDNYADKIDMFIFNEIRAGSIDEVNVKIRLTIDSIGRYPKGADSFSKPVTYHLSPSSNTKSIIFAKNNNAHNGDFPAKIFFSNSCVRSVEYCNNGMESIPLGVRIGSSTTWNNSMVARRSIEGLFSRLPKDRLKCFEDITGITKEKEVKTYMIHSPRDPKERGNIITKWLYNGQVIDPELKSMIEYPITPAFQFMLSMM